MGKNGGQNRWKIFHSWNNINTHKIKQNSFSPKNGDLKTLMDEPEEKSWESKQEALPVLIKIIFDFVWVEVIYVSDYGVK